MGGVEVVLRAKGEDIPTHSLAFVHIEAREIAKNEPVDRVAATSFQHLLCLDPGSRWRPTSFGVDVFQSLQSIRVQAALVHRVAVGLLRDGLHRRRVLLGGGALRQWQATDGTGVS